MALGGGLGGPEVGRFTVDHEKECSKVGIRDRSGHRARWVKREVPKGSKLKKPDNYQQKEKKIVA